MPTESGIKECPKCRAIMFFVSFVDKKTKEKVSSEFAGKGHKPEGPPPETLKKYRCPNDGHEETNE